MDFHDQSLEDVMHQSSHTHTPPTGMAGLMRRVITFWMYPQCCVSAGNMISCHYSWDYSGGTDRRKSMFYVYFTGIMAFFYQSTNDKISREQDNSYNRKRKWEKFYKYIYSSSPSILFYKIKILFVLRFYGPVNPMESCRARSVYLTTRLLGRFSPLSG